MNVIVRQSCRICGSRMLSPVIDLGEQMLATAFVKAENEDLIPRRPVPLEVVRCDPQRDEQACGLVQLRHTFPSDVIYSDYWYASGVNQTMRDALADVVRSASEFTRLRTGNVVLDIGCNDGTLLNQYPDLQLRKIGFDPALNFADLPTDTFVRLTTYFNRSDFLAASGGERAKIVTSIAMFYDLEDPGSFVREIAEILDRDGIWIVQMADLPTMLTNCMYDNIAHEHLEYYHLAPIERLLRDSALKLVDLEMNDINGSSYRLYVRPAGGPGPTKDASRRLQKRRLYEFNMALDTDAPFDEFRQRVEKNKRDLLALLERLRTEGKTVFVYGASMKGNVLLQYCGIDRSIVPFAADRNPRKWGARTLGTDIPIISEEEARSLRPDYFLVLPYHFLDEMLQRERAFLEAGGKFIVPAPSVSVVG